MAVFHYVAKDRQGIGLSGVLEAKVLDEAVSILRRKDLLIISVKEKKLAGMKETAVKLDDLAIFTRELASMVGAGITLVRALRILSEQTENKMLALVTLMMKDDVIAGASFSDTVAKHPRVFSSLYVHMVKTGEICGFLNDVLNRLAIYLEKSADLQRKIRTAMVYPIVVVSMAVIITALLLVKVVPTFAAIFKTLGGELPLATQVLILVSTIFRKFLPVLIGVFFLLSLWWKRYIDTPQGRYWFDHKKLKLPIFGPLIRKIAIARFSRTFSLLVKSAVPLLNALDIVGKTAGNKVIEAAVQGTIENVKQGESISGGLSKGGVFPPMVLGMIGIGENTGQLSEMLTNIADLYDQQVDAMVGSLTAMIEPLVIGFLGIVVGGIVVALFMPIFTITQLIH